MALSVTEASRPVHKVSMTFDVKVPMRDGVELSTDIYLPEIDSPSPTILIRTPYDNNNEAVVQDCMYFATRGYAVAAQDVRGRWDSPGEWYPFRFEAEDGYDTQEWLGRQDWCDGNVGTAGGSYVAMVQWQSAPMRSKYLKAMVPRVGYSNFYHNWAYTGGAFQLAFNYRWAAIQMHTRTNQTHYLWFPEENNMSTLFWHLPLNTMAEAAGRSNRVWKDWIAHPSYDDYWKAMRPTEESYTEIDVPVYGMGGWYDVFLQGTLNNYMGVSQQGLEPGKSNQKVVIGPWIHSLGDSGRDTGTGDVEFGESVRIDLMDEHVRWFDYWLKGIDTGIQDEPPVNVFVMGANQWRAASDWPLPDTQYTPYYLRSQGGANSMFGNGTLNTSPPSTEESDQFVFDPNHPVLTVGGSTCCSEDLTPVSMGPRDQQQVEWRPDVLVYSSPVLDQDVDVIGPVKMTLYAASDAPDTDFTAKLVDVHPNGSVINIAQGIIRARYRDSWEAPTLLEPGKIYEYTIDLWSTSNRFLKGHQIRVEVSSSNFPQFDRNPNTGHAFGMDTETRIAHQTIYHDEDHPSHILLPIVPTN